MCVCVCIHVYLYVFALSADSCTNMLFVVHEHLPDLEYLVREKQLVDRASPILSTKANNVEFMAYPGLLFWTVAVPLIQSTSTIML